MAQWLKFKQMPEELSTLPHLPLIPLIELHWWVIFQNKVPHVGCKRQMLDLCQDQQNKASK